MKTFKVNLWIDNDEHSAPDKIIFVETDFNDRTSIKNLALQKAGIQPSSYKFDIEEVFNLDELSVIEIVGSDKADKDRWYYGRDGEYFVVLYIHNKGKYMTCSALGKSSTVGYIEPEFCSVITTFKA